MLDTGILIFLLLLVILASVRSSWVVFEHSLTKSVLFQLGLTELFPQHIPYIQIAALDCGTTIIPSTLLLVFIM